MALVIQNRRGSTLVMLEVAVCGGRPSAQEDFLFQQGRDTYHWPVLTSVSKEDGFRWLPW